MGNKNPKEAVVLSEINQAELRRAKAVMRDPVFMDWVQKFREKYIVNGFLIPVYMSGGRMFIAELRVKQFGDYILPWEMYDRVFYENPKAWIRAEDTWFWTYLMLGQKILIPKMGIPEKYKVRGMPAKGIAREIRVIAKQLKLSDSDGGGILRSPQDWRTITWQRPNLLLSGPKGTTAIWNLITFRLRHDGSTNFTCILNKN